MKYLFALAALILTTQAHATSIMTQADPDDERARQIVSFVIANSTLPNSVIARKLQNVEYSNMAGRIADVKAVELSSEVNGSKEDSHEVRKFLVVVPFLERQSTHFDENEEYRSNTAFFSSVTFECDMEAESYGSERVSIVCK